MYIPMYTNTLYIHTAHLAEECVPQFLPTSRVS